MLARGLHDALWMWPIVFWPIVFSSCLYAIVRICQASRTQYGFSPLDPEYRPDAAILYVFFPIAAIFEVTTHAYLLYAIGYEYLVVAVAIYILGWILLPWFLDNFKPAQYLLPVAYICFACMFIVLLGFMDIPILRAVNADLYGLLTGVPANI